MSKELEDLLLTYLGELMNERERTYDWIEVDKIKNKLNAVYVLLGIDKHESSFLEVVKDHFITIKNS